MPFRDVRIAIRLLLKSPGFTAAAVLMLALGIGATTAVFSVVEGVLLRPLPFPHSEDLVQISDVVQGAEEAGGKGEVGVTAPDIQAYTRDTQSFESLGGYQQTNYELSGMGEPAQVNASRLTGGVFPTLEVAPLLGRFFTQQEDDQKEPVAVLSYSLWQNRLQGDRRVLGTKILLDRKPYVVIGVMPRNFEFPLVPGHLNRSELWVPMSFTHDEIAQGARGWSFYMVGRLRPGVTTRQAQQGAQGAAREIIRNFPPALSQRRIHPLVSRLDEATVAQARPLVRMLFFAVMVVLFIACANLAGLLLVRTLGRRREIAVRVALGANGTAILRQSLVEAMLLSMIGALIGLGLAWAALQAGVSLLPETLPRVSSIGIDWRVVTFALGLAVFTGLLCGLIPGLEAMRAGLGETLKEGGRTGTPSGARGHLRSA